MRDMALDSSTIDDLSDYYSFVVAPDGTCVLNPRVPQLVGSKPWDWCVAEDQEECRDAFIEACMFRKENIAVECDVLFEGRKLRIHFRLYPLETGQVLCLFHRVFEGELTRRERHVLVLVAGGANAEQVADVLGITPSTVRDHIANIKRKLSIRNQEGFRLAAHHFGLSRTTYDAAGD